MFSPKMMSNLVPWAFFCSALFAQQKPQSAPSVAGPLEFPVVFQQSITAGKTPAGSKVQAKLGMATLVNGTVVPRNATFSGEVVESVAKTKTEPSRLAIRMDSAQWKEASATFKIYLTAWYFPNVEQPEQNLQYGPEQPASGRTWNGAGSYPDPNSPVYKPFPSAADTSKDSPVPNVGASTPSKHRLLMKDVDSEHGTGGAIILVSKRSNLKLDRFTTYVFASSDLQAAK